MDAFTFEKLQVWQKARLLVKEVYNLIDKFPNTEKYGLSNQLSRAVVSVPSNIAEGCGRPSLRERTHFYEIAYGSLMESYTQLILACDLDYITAEELQSVKPLINEISRMLSGLRKSLIDRINQGE